MKRNYFMILVALFLTISIMGCNMLRGAGEDIEATGKNVQETVGHND